MPSRTLSFERLKNPKNASIKILELCKAEKKRV